jgi:hypothetical protein
MSPQAGACGLRNSQRRNPQRAEIFTEKADSAGRNVIDMNAMFR